MGLFSRKNDAPAAASAAPAAESRLVSPGLPATHPRQLAHDLLVGTGLGVALRGPGPVADCFRALAEASPALLESEAVGAGFGTVRQDPAGLWMAWSSASGSAIVYCAMPDSDPGFVLHHVTDPIMSVRGRFGGDLICLGASSDAALVEIINTGELVPVWDLPGLEHRRPAEAPPLSLGYRALADAVRETLLSSGGEQLDGDMVKATVGTGDGRSQLLFVALQPRILLLSPIAHTVDGALPPVLRSLDRGPYDLDVVADLVVLVEAVEDQVPMALTADDVIGKAVELARFADRVEASISAADDL